MRISDWSSDVCSSDLGRRNIADALDPLQQLVLLQEDAVPEVVRLDARQAERMALLAEGGDGLRRGQQRRAATLIDAPGAGGRQVHLGVWVVQALLEGGHEVAALGLRNDSHEVAPMLRVKPAHAARCCRAARSD